MVLIDHDGHGWYEGCAARRLDGWRICKLAVEDDSVMDGWELGEAVHGWLLKLVYDGIRDADRGQAR
jgi:hypothetical protein